MKLNKLHAATMAPAPSHIKPREEKGEVRYHQRARRSSSDDNSRPKTGVPENRITTIPELTESFEKRLCVRDKRAVNNDDRLWLICHEDMRKNGGVQELHCANRFHKEEAHRLEQCRPRSGSEAASCQVRRLSDERRKSADGPISLEEKHTLCRQLSLRRHR
ncbi:putative leukemia NUP98 fusion partner 1 [Scophthalmus maximus]|uniref:Putative leukemia NUP98 fusion partner 1 n=1 Tax=Scophthalmus maximus TaxID=52904 RepID=A0A2U9C484_SCOMX|nr:putative leukemia NUP98 fusion partner 1 [Scophthalmus maximus]